MINQAKFLTACRKRKTNTLIDIDYEPQLAKYMRLFELLEEITKQQCSAAFLARRIGTTERTVIRYIHLLRWLEFDITCIKYKYYHTGKSLPQWMNKIHALTTEEK